MKTNRLFPLFLASLAIAANAEIEKIASPCEQQICFYWWPKLPSVEGWHQEREASFRYSSNALAPDGFNFSNAEAVIYARALYKPREPRYTDVAALMASDKQAFEHGEQPTTSMEVQSLRTADGQTLKSMTFTPQSQGNWEQVSYGEEGDFYLLFTLSARSSEAFNKAKPAYEKLLRTYRSVP